MKSEKLMRSLTTQWYRLQKKDLSPQINSMSLNFVENWHKAEVDATRQFNRFRSTNNFGANFVFSCTVLLKNKNETIASLSILSIYLYRQIDYINFCIYIFKCDITIDFRSEKYMK